VKALMIAAVTAAVAAGTLVHAQVPTFKSRVDLVSFSVTVTDREGNFVTSLKQDNFEIYEDGVRQPIKLFVPGGSGRDIAPLHLGALLDISGSMERDMSLAASAAVKFLRTLDDARDMTLVDFDTEVRLATYSPADFPSLVERIRSRKAEGDTALYDAVAVYLRTAAVQDGRKVLVLYTDGGDNNSRTRWNDVLRQLKGSDVVLYSVGLIQNSLVALETRARLQRMAEITGGLAYFPASLGDLDGVYEKIRDEIRAQYTLGYVSSNTRRDGRWRKVQIKITGEGVGKLKLRTRDGYYAPVSQSR
jgi:Ca-activated chloride channel family protein